MLIKPGAALLFDIDGTLADTDPVHLEAFNRTFEPFGHHFDKPRFSLELQGKANAVIAERFVPQLSIAEREAVMAGKEVRFRQLAGTQIHAVSGLFQLLDWADAQGIPMAAVTNAPRANAALILDSLGIAARFKAIVIGDELAYAKPHPMPYLEGLRLIGGTAAHAVAFEDSRTGIASACAAGIATIGIRTGLEDAELRGAGASLSAATYEDAALLDFVKARLMAEA